MSTKKKGSIKCSMREKVFPEPCSGLLQILESIHPRSTGKGITKLAYTDLETLKPSRTFIIAKLGEHKKNGLILNFCPFCGERIDGAVTEVDGKP
jgi:hypothetical protein